MLARLLAEIRPSRVITTLIADRAAAPATDPAAEDLRLLISAARDHARLVAAVLAEGNTGTAGELLSSVIDLLNLPDAAPAPAAAPLPPVPAPTF